MRKSLKKAGGQVQWVELPRGKNRKSWSRNITKRYERMLNFLDTSLRQTQ
jgi:dipeptidyl aminopeptidase/acylaminoacyl peptidase